jgi:hypothetical protein
LNTLKISFYLKPNNLGFLLMWVFFINLVFNNFIPSSKRNTTKLKFSNHPISIIDSSGHYDTISLKFLLEERKEKEDKVIFHYLSKLSNNNFNNLLKREFISTTSLDFNIKKIIPLYILYHCSKTDLN